MKTNKNRFIIKGGGQPLNPLLDYSRCHAFTYILLRISRGLYWKRKQVYHSVVTQTQSFFQRGISGKTRNSSSFVSYFSRKLCEHEYSGSRVAETKDCKNCGLQCCDFLAIILWKREFFEFLVTASEKGSNDPNHLIGIKKYASYWKSFWRGSFRNYQTEGIKASINWTIEDSRSHSGMAINHNWILHNFYLPRELNFVKKVGDFTQQSGNRTATRKNGTLFCWSHTLKKFDLSAITKSSALVFPFRFPEIGQRTEKIRQNYHQELRSNTHTTRQSGNWKVSRTGYPGQNWKRYSICTVNVHSEMVKEFWVRFFGMTWNRIIRSTIMEHQWNQCNESTMEKG